MGLTIAAILRLLQKCKRMKDTMNHKLSIWQLAPGTVLRVNHGLYDHVALVSDRIIDGERAVLGFSAAYGGLVEEPYSMFKGSRTVTCDGYPGKLAPQAVLWRARASAGRRYSWFAFNCEHFIREAHGLQPESPQLRNWLLAIGLVGAFARLTA
jgi:hypothetical protein